MINIDLRNLTSDDIKDIMFLKKAGVSDEVIQTGYENTKKNREENNDD